MQPHILIIDDEAEIRRLLSQYLSRRGYRITDAANEQAARQVIQHDPPHLIICDLQLSNGDGFVLLQAFRQALPSVPTILLTGIPFEPAVVDSTLLHLVSAYVPKPAKLDKVAEEIRRLLTPAFPPLG